jgi:DNA repair photolyase
MRDNSDSSRSQSLAAKKAWKTIRSNNRKKAAKGSSSIDEFLIQGNKEILYGDYNIGIPLVKPSKLSSKDNGGVGKDLSEGWACNFAIGCTHACPFCYVDSIHRRYRSSTFGFENVPWGYYLYIPRNMKEAISKTNWSRWENIEVMLSSTHDPYLPKLRKYTRKILETSLPEGVRYCIQTRSPLVLKDLDIIQEYPDQVRLQISVGTLNEKFSKLIEPRVALPRGRLDIISKAKEAGVNTGIIVAPVFPPLSIRPNPEADVADIFSVLSDIQPDHIYGESLHIRGINLKFIEQSIGESLHQIDLDEFDRSFGIIFERLLEEHRLEGQWWPDHRKNNH